MVEKTRICNDFLFKIQTKYIFIKFLLLNSYGADKIAGFKLNFLKIYSELKFTFKISGQNKLINIS